MARSTRRNARSFNNPANSPEVSVRRGLRVLRHTRVMVAQRRSPQSAAKWRSEDDVWIDHASLDLTDVEWLSGVRRLTLWAVKMPSDLLASLPQLEW